MFLVYEVWLVFIFTKIINFDIELFRVNRLGRCLLRKLQEVCSCSLHSFFFYWSRVLVNLIHIICIIKLVLAESRSLRIDSVYIKSDHSDLWHGNTRDSLDDSQNMVDLFRYLAPLIGVGVVYESSLFIECNHQSIHSSIVKGFRIIPKNYWCNLTFDDFNLWFIFKRSQNLTSSAIKRR